jgi:multiple RNA-binding domain-containing protein 1
MTTDDQKKDQDIIPHDAEDDLYDDLPSATKNDQPSASSTSDNEDNDDTIMEEDKEDTTMDDGDDDKKIDGNENSGDDDIPERAKAIQREETKSNNETIGLIEDTGRLFVRNLSYSCSEQDLRDTFTKYGPISEVCDSLPFFQQTVFVLTNTRNTFSSLMYRYICLSLRTPSNLKVTPTSSFYSPNMPSMHTRIST